MGRKPLSDGETAATMSITLPIQMHMVIADYCEEFNFTRSGLIRLAMDNYFNEGNTFSEQYKELQNKTNQVKENEKEIKSLKSKLQKTEKELEESNMIIPAITSLKQELSEVKRENKILVKERDRASRQLNSIKKKLSRLIE